MKAMKPCSNHVSAIWGTPEARGSRGRSPSSARLWEGERPHEPRTWAAPHESPIRVGTILMAPLLAVTLLLPACARRAAEAPADATASAKPEFVESFGGPVIVRLSATPPVVRLDRDTLLAITVTAPANVQVKLPPIENRLTGFTVAGSFDKPPAVDRDGRTIRERSVRLQPQAAPRYRIAPMAIVWHDRSGQEQSFATRALVLSSEPLVKGDPGSSLASARSPVRIYPGFGSVLLYLVVAAGLGAMGVLAWWAAKRIHREVRLRRMSPRERALHELAELLSRDLVNKDRVKDFYFELTMIVRAYIERAHAIRAPEQTTEEFLMAVSQDPRFSPAVITRLRAFLQAADLVKYAAYRPDKQSVDQSLATARNYVETDAEEQPAAPAPSHR